MMTNIPEVVAEVHAVFAMYQMALVNNDAKVLNMLFLNSPDTVRYGTRENLYGYDMIEAFRNARPGTHLERDILRCVITTFGTEFATTNIEFQLKGSTQISRQSQTWVKMNGAWRVVSAHVSNMS